MDPSHTLVLLLIAQFCCSVETAAPKTNRSLKAKTRKFVAGKEINWKLPYYKEKFLPCKQFRPLNPVENVRARAYATVVFKRCGPKLIVEFGEKYNFPAHGIERIVEIICKGATIAFAYVADDGSTVLQPKTPSAPILKIIDGLLDFAIQLNMTLIFNMGKKRYVLSPHTLKSFVTAIAQCFFNEPIMAQLDLDYIKHAADYYKLILL